MERTLNNSKTPHEKDKQQQQQPAPTSQASIGKKPTAHRTSSSKGPTTSALSTKHGKSSGSATAQAVKKLAQMPSGHTERGRGASRSVNYLSSTAASRAKAASTAQIHKPTASMSVNRLLVHGGVKSEGALRRPRSVNNNNNVLEDGGRRMVKGKSRSQAAFKSPVAAGSNNLRRKSVASAEMLRSKSNNRKPAPLEDKKTKDEGGRKVSTDKVRSSSAAAIGRKATSSLSSTVSQKPSKQSSRRTSSRSGRLVRVTMNRTSELRAALHRPASGKRTGKSSDTSSRSGSRKSYNRPNTTASRDSKSKRRSRKRASSDALTAPVLDLATKNHLIDDVNDNEREIFHV